jgi:hypothetical protein
MPIFSFIHPRSGERATILGHDETCVYFTGSYRSAMYEDFLSHRGPGAWEDEIERFRSMGYRNVTVHAFNETADVAWVRAEILRINGENATKRLAR